MHSPSPDGSRHPRITLSYVPSPAAAPHGNQTAPGAAAGVDWEQGRWFRNGKRERDIRVTIASDWAPIWGYENLANSDPLAVYGDLLPHFRASDLNLVNVECALCQDGQPILKAGPPLRADPETARPLAAVPFHVACLANNHTLDYGPEGLRQTLEALQQAGLATVGAGMDGSAAARPARFDAAGTRIAILNFAEGEACCSVENGPGAAPFDPGALEPQIRQLKREADIVVAIFHGGRELAPVPPVYVMQGLRRLAEAGADAIVGHHPHVPQGMEIHHGTPIIYSQGNFVFFHGEASRFQTAGYLVHLDIAERALTGLEITPYRMQPTGVFCLQDREKTQFLRTLERASGYLTDPQKVQQAWEAFADEMGAEGLRGKLHNLLALSEKDPVLAAAQLRNLFFTPAHRELYLTGLRRISEGTIGSSPAWARTLVREWRT